MINMVLVNVHVLMLRGMQAEVKCRTKHESKYNFHQS